MDVIFTIVVAVLVLGFLVIIHEGGHYCAARVFGVRVTEFMVGMPGPNIGFKVGETKFGITPILLGGYARICGMEPGELNPYVKPAMISLFKSGSKSPCEIADELGIDEDDAEQVLEILVEWGCAKKPKRRGLDARYLSSETCLTRKQRRADGMFGWHMRTYAAGEARDIAPGEEEAVYQCEYHKQYRSLPFWKRCIIVAAGPVVNIAFAILALVIVYTVIGITVQNTQTGEIFTYHVPILTSIQAVFMYIGMVIEAVVQLFNPSTAAEVVENSASVIGIAVISRRAFEAGLVNLLEFMAMISVSLGIMNLVPIVPLDGGRLIVEVFQKIFRRPATIRVMNALTFVGLALCLLLFVVMVNQDVSRFIFGNW